MRSSERGENCIGHSRSVQSTKNCNCFKSINKMIHSARHYRSQREATLSALSLNVQTVYFWVFMKRSNRYTTETLAAILADTSSQSKPTCKPFCQVTQSTTECFIWHTVSIHKRISWSCESPDRTIINISFAGEHMVMTLKVTRDSLQPKTWDSWLFATLNIFKWTGAER